MTAGPDQGFAWVIAVACFIINFIMAGLARSVGVLFVAIIDLYGVSREAATTPFSIRVCVRNLTGPLVGLLGLKYGIRGVTVVGGFVAALGSIFCYFAPNVLWITIFWGVIHGLGFGLSTVLHMIAINQYFDKYRASALGLGYSGDCFGSFTFPIFIEYLFSIYDVRGSFLIIGGIVLNVIPMALLLRKPPWINDGHSDPKTNTSKPQTHLALKNDKNILSLEGNKTQKTHVHSCGFLNTVNEHDSLEKGERSRSEVHRCISDYKKISEFPRELKAQYNEAFNASEMDLNALNKENDTKNEAKFILGIPENSMSPNRSPKERIKNDQDSNMHSCSSNQKTGNTFKAPNFCTLNEIRTSRSASDLCIKNDVLCSANRSLRLEKKPYCNVQSKTESLPPLFEKEKSLKNSRDDEEVRDFVEKSDDLENECSYHDGTGTLKKRTTSFASQVAHEIVNKMRTASFASQVAQDGFVANINQETGSDSEVGLECELKSIVEHKGHDVENCTHRDIILSVDKNMIEEYFKSIPEKQNVEVEDKQKAPSILKVLIHTNTKPMFILISISMAVYAFLFVAIVTIIIDYAADQGIPADRGKYLIIGFSVADLIGRLTFGQVIDRKLMKIKNYAGSTMLLMGILSASIPLNISFNYMMVCMCMYGGIQGGTAIMFPILVNTYMDKNSESVAMGSLNFYGGLLMLLLAPMIGFFRDNTGSYNSVFYISGGVNAIVGIIWQFEPMILKFQNRKLKEKYVMNEIHGMNLRK